MRRCLADVLYRHSFEASGAMAFLAYLVVLIFAGGAALFGLDLITAPLPEHHNAPPQLSAASKPNKVAKRQADVERHDTAANNKDLTPVYPANPGGVREVGADKASTTASNASSSPARETTGAAPAAAAAETSTPAPKPAVKTAEVSPPTKDAPPAAPAVVPTQAVAQQSAGHCDVQACSSAYRSFRASDCTYQPFEGPRRACTAPPATQARNDAGPTHVTRQGTRVSMAPAAVSRYEELRRGQSDNDEYDDDDDDAGYDRNVNAYGPGDGYPGSVIIIRRPRGW